MKANTSEPRFQPQSSTEFEDEGFSSRGGDDYWNNTQLHLQRPVMPTLFNWMVPPGLDDSDV